MLNSKWEVLVKDKQRRQKDAIRADWLLKTPPDDSVLDVRHIPDSCGILTDREREITNTTDVELILNNLASSKWSSEEVTTAFYKRAIIAHQLVNCLTEIFVDDALERARALDKHLKDTGRVVGPLHGLPMSLKDQICIKGLEATMGYSSNIGKYSENHAVLTQILIDCGAVPFVMTNVPQTLMWPETYNLVYGRTRNPANRNLTCGGSSGGEGALVGIKGSPLGVGSDIGGSVRYPSVFNGVYGLRTSTSRIPYGGCMNSLEGQDSAPSSLGPISGSLSGLKAFMKSVIAQKPWLYDPLVVRKKWDEDSYNLEDHGNGKNLCFAMMWDDGDVVPHPPFQRAMKMTKDALEKAGHKVIPWTPPSELHRDLYKVLAEIWFAGGHEDITAILALTDEPYLASMALEGAQPIDTGITHTDDISAYKLWQYQKSRRTLREQYFAYWRSTVKDTGTGRPVDAIIGPVAPFAAPPHGQTKVSAYTVIWSALNYPCCVFPVTSVDAELDPIPSPETFLSKDDEENHKLYDPETFKYAPVGLQLIGQTLEDEAVLAMTEIVDRALKA